MAFTFKYGHDFVAETSGVSCILMIVVLMQHPDKT